MLTEVQRNIEKYVEPAKPFLEQMGGLPVDMQERLVNRWMNEGLIEMESEEPIAPSKWRNLKVDPSFPKEYLRTEDGYKIYLVDGDALIKRYGLKYFWGAHGYYFGFIPKNEIWVRKEGENMTKEDIEITIKHELVEAKAMANGVPYRQAHSLSEYSEKKWKKTRK